MHAEIFNFWTFPERFEGTTLYFIAILASVDLPREENILHIQEYSQEYRGSRENMMQRIWIALGENSAERLNFR